MPAKRLPWYKVWAEHTDHEKICELSDGEYRTWHYLLAAAAQQPIRWRFASTKHAAAATNRPERHIKRLVTDSLLDLREDGLWIHDWQIWQRWVAGEEHANDTGTTHERLHEEHANNSRTTREAPSRPLETGDRSPTGLLREGEREIGQRPAASAPKVLFDAEEARLYAIAKGYSGEQSDRIADKFLAHHTAGGWKRRGGVVIKDQMAAWHHWIGNELEYHPPAEQTYTQPGQRRPDGRIQVAL